MQAIISVANREGVVALGRELQTRNVSIFSTSGTAGVFEEASIKVEAVSSLTGFPEIQGGMGSVLGCAEQISGSAALF